MIKRGPGYRCSVKSCKNSYANSNNCHFFRFPKDDEKAKQWIIACNHDLMETAKYNVHKVHIRICSDHFEDKMYANDLKNRLLPSAQPTLKLNDENNGNVANVEILAKNNTLVETSIPQSVEIEQISENCTNVQGNVLSTAGNITSLPVLPDFGIKHNEVMPETIILEPIHSVSISFQPSIDVSSANRGITANPKVAVTAPSYVVRSSSSERVVTNKQHNTVQLGAKRSFDKTFQTTKDLCTCPKTLKLQKEIRILKKENIALRAQLKRTDVISKDHFLKYFEKLFGPQMILFVKEQISVQNQKAKGRRYSLQFKRLCLNLYFKGPRAYRTLSSIFSLPSKATLNRMSSNISFTKGINQNVFDLLSIKVVSMKETEKYCMVCFDEMSLKCHLYYDTKADEVIGLHDNGGKKQFKRARLACAFIARGIFGDWKQALAYELSNTACPSTILNELLKQCIFKLQDIGLKVVIVVCDRGPTNIQLSNDLGITHQIPYFTLNDQKIFFMFDVPHLLKATRNMFLKYNFKFGNFVAKMDYVRQFYEMDKMQQFKFPHSTSDCLPTDSRLFPVDLKSALRS